MRAMRQLRLGERGPSCQPHIRKMVEPAAKRVKGKQKEVGQRKKPDCAGEYLKNIFESSPQQVSSVSPIPPPRRKENGLFRVAGTCTPLSQTGATPVKTVSWESRTHQNRRNLMQLVGYLERCNNPIFLDSAADIDSITAASKGTNYKPLNLRVMRNTASRFTQVPDADGQQKKQAINERSKGSKKRCAFSGPIK